MAKKRKGRGRGRGRGRGVINTPVAVGYDESNEQDQSDIGIVGIKDYDLELKDTEVPSCSSRSDQSDVPAQFMLSDSDYKAVSVSVEYEEQETEPFTEAEMQMLPENMTPPMIVDQISTTSTSTIGELIFGPVSEEDLLQIRYVPVPVGSAAAGTEKGGKQPEQPFHTIRKSPKDMARDKSTKQLKKMRKELKRMGAHKKIKKSLASFLGSKEKYNFEEMVREVQLGLKVGESEANFCSLGSLVQRPPVLGKTLHSFDSTQMSGFRLHHDGPIHVISSEDATKEGIWEEEGQFRVPAVPKVKIKRVKNN